jgi:hypothetical protein
MIGWDSTPPQTPWLYALIQKTLNPVCNRSLEFLRKWMRFTLPYTAYGMALD